MGMLPCFHSGEAGSPGTPVVYISKLLGLMNEQITYLSCYHKTFGASGLQLVLSPHKVDKCMLASHLVLY